jgi:excisionase family DNA binding protein
MTESKGRLLTVPELARRLRLSRGRTYVLLGRGDIPRIMVGGAIRIDSRDVEEYLEARRRGKGKAA